MTSFIYCKLVLLIIVLSLTWGCSNGYAPVSDIGSPLKTNKNSRYVNTNKKVRNIPKTYKVRSGDTLYSIAWKYGLDFKKLAQQNKINAHYLIYSGQVLKIKALTGNEKVSAKKDAVLNKKSKASRNKDNNTESNRYITAKSANNIQKKSTISKTKTVNLSTAKQPHKPLQKMRWSWPSKGAVLNRFNSENKGLNFKGNTGDNVFAAASGIVVYAGNGIIGYGNLIIIKHSDEYLSAYAHNSVILIKEHMKIKGGQKVAEIGSTGTTKTMLHFEIRKDGKPVNPQKYLPIK